jgi:hypothetical protein
MQNERSSDQIQRDHLSAAKNFLFSLWNSPSSCIWPNNGQPSLPSHQSNEQLFPWLAPCKFLACNVVFQDKIKNNFTSWRIMTPYHGTANG